MEGPTGGIRSARPCHSARRPGPTGSPERLATTARFCLRAPRAMKVCVWTTAARGSTGRVQPLSISAKTGITSPAVGSRGGGVASVSPSAALTSALFPNQLRSPGTWRIALSVNLGREGDKATTAVPGSGDFLQSSRLRGLVGQRRGTGTGHFVQTPGPAPRASRPPPAEGGLGAAFLGSS